ncbi:hypothetical protein HY629_02330 [Candidatus Uhrbacteria bacterium]|nr:hypothetical protein [Candidatus Uhrbacteria bacterium]
MTYADLGLAVDPDAQRDQMLRLLISVDGLMGSHGITADVRVPVTACYIGTSNVGERGQRFTLGVDVTRSRVKQVRLYLQLPWQPITLDLKRYPELLDRNLPQRRQLYITQLVGGSRVVVVVWSKRENAGLPPVFSQSEWHAQKQTNKR